MTHNIISNTEYSRFLWPRGLRCGFATACFLGLQVRRPPGEWFCLLWVLWVVR